MLCSHLLYPDIPEHCKVKVAGNENRGEERGYDRMEGGGRGGRKEGREDGRREYVQRKRRKERERKGKQTNIIGKNNSKNYAVGIIHTVNRQAKILIFRIVLWKVVIKPLQCSEMLLSFYNSK